MASGLDDFLKHIKSNPQNDVLIDRFTSLVGELDAASRQPYFEKLFTTLETVNPHGALRVAYFNLQAARAQATGTPQEIDALQWIEKAFLKLGKAEHASLVKGEYERLRKSLPPPVPVTERRKKKNQTKPPKPPKPDQKSSMPRADFISSLYESFAKELIASLRKELMSYQGKPQNDEAAAHIIQSFRRVYAEMKSTLRNALAVFGHNPLLVTEQDTFREDIVQVFLKSPVFGPGKDRIAAQRARLVASLMTAWFDQQQQLPESLIPETDARLHHKLLEIAISAVLRFED